MTTEVQGNHQNVPHSKNHHIIINGSEHEASGTSITYRELVNSAFPGDSGEIIYLIQYVSPHGSDGQLHDGESVDLINGMKFDVERSHRS